MEYKLGELLELVTEQNTSLEYGLDDIVGVTIEKEMIPTIANLKETALDNFTIVRPHDFIYNPRTHGKKIGLGYNDTDRCYIATWNNNTFRVKKDKEDIILADYLYLYFKREIWDKEACFHAWGSSTVVLSWESFCEMGINLPPLEEQQKIVRQYKTITDRIGVLERINEELEHLMVLTYNSKIDNQELEEVTLDDVLDFHDAKRKPLSAEERTGMARNYPYYGAASIVDYVEDFIFEGTYILVSEDGANIIDEQGHPLLQFTYGKFWVNNHAHIVKGKHGYEEASIYALLSQLNFQSIVTGAAQPKISQASLKGFVIQIPNEEIIDDINKSLSPILDSIILNVKEIDSLKLLQNTFLEKNF